MIVAGCIILQCIFVSALQEDITHRLKRQIQFPDQTNHSKIIHGDGFLFSMSWTVPPFFQRRLMSLAMPTPQWIAPPERTGVVGSTPAPSFVPKAGVSPSTIRIRIRKRESLALQGKCFASPKAGFILRHVLPYS